VRITIAQGSSEARFRVREQLARQPLPNEAVGSTRDMMGAIVLNGSGAVVAAESRVQVDLRTLTSDQRSRDNFIQRNTLQTSQFPTADFAVKEVAGMPWPLPPTGSASFQLIGDLTVHGVTRPTIWQVTAELRPTEIVAQAFAAMEISDFGMEPPRAGPVLSIEDDIRLELDVTATRA
jgi:polyisoprenoid-binding protein YceI